MFELSGSGFHTVSEPRRDHWSSAVCCVVVSQECTQIFCATDKGTTAPLPPVPAALLIPMEKVLSQVNKQNEIIKKRGRRFGVYPTTVTR